MTTLAISVGDPAGIGPEVSVRAAADARDRARLVLFGDGPRLVSALRTIGSPADTVDPKGDLGGPLGSVGVAHVAEWNDDVVELHEPTALGGGLQLAILEAATQATVDRRADALVTGPVAKEAIVASGQAFEGHTEWLARRVGLADDAVTMLFIGPRLSVGLVTTHRSIRDVPSAITSPRVERTVIHLAEALAMLGGPPHRTLEVCGLNPHAGEGGLFGEEEVRVVTPTVARLNNGTHKSLHNTHILGPSPSETVFRRAAAGGISGVVAMYHDQATIASKLLDFGHAVNVTWGLPFIRTSVDHGVAYDAARHATADDSGMRAAVAMALELTQTDRTHPTGGLQSN